MKREQPDAGYYMPREYRIQGPIKTRIKKRVKLSKLVLIDEKWEKRKKELAEMPYYEYIETPEWKERRQKHFKTAGFRCRLCNAKDYVLHVHHRTYKNRGDEKFFDLIVLCENCHHLFHEKMEIIP